jgi:predicted RND superfamily exporter protein
VTLRSASRGVRRGLLRGVLAGVSRPRLTLAGAAVIVTACSLLAFFRLHVSAESNELFSHKVAFFRNWLDFNKLFPENEATYVVVEPVDIQNAPPVVPPTARWTAVADAIAAKLRSIPNAVESVDERVPLDQLGKQGILFEDPHALRHEIDEARGLAQLARLWGESNPVLRLLGPNPTSRFLAGARLAGNSDQQVQFTKVVADGWNAALASPSEPLTLGHQIPDLRALGPTDPETLGYYYVPDQSDLSRHLLLIKVFEREDFSAVTAEENVVSQIRRAVAEAARAYPEFSAGLTGRPVLDADEDEITDRDSRRSEIVALIAVFIGLVVMLRSVWLAFAAELALAVGLGWTFGYATISVGRLNLLSTVFIIALIGIGMDYLVQLLTRYRQEAARHARPSVIWIAVFRYVGPPVTTACFGAAAAFFVSVFTDFRGAAELGIIAGGGLLLCLLSGYTVLPALLTVFPARVDEAAAARIEPDRQPSKLSRWRLLLPLSWLLLLCFAIPLAFRTEFNPNLIDLQAPDLPSVKLVKKIQTWSAVVLSKDLNVLREARKALAGADTVASTDSILNADDDYAMLRAAAGDLKVQWTAPDPVRAEDLPQIAERAAALAGTIEAGKTEQADRLAAAKSLRDFAERVRSPGDPAAAAARLSAWQVAFVAELQTLLSQLQPPPLDLAKVPPQLRSHYVSNDGVYALYINPSGDLWKQAQLAQFMTQVESRVATVPAKPMVTGIASDIYHSTASIEHSFYSATAYALAIIVVLVLFDLGRLDQTLLAVSVLALGLPMLVGLMGLFKVPWNFANFFGLPILIGAGHEYGVFMVHRYREACHDPRRAWRWWDSSDRALFLCAYVTSSSFGFFWLFAHHLGLRSLGWVMAVGTLCIYLAAVTVVRPILRWRLDKHICG